MFRINVGWMDRVMRVFVGLGVVLGYFLDPDGRWSWLYLLGLVPLITGLVGNCPVYTLLGFSTARPKE